jgi:chromosome segregation ATPase
MAMPARKLEWEGPVEDRLGKLEAQVEHIRTDISDLKVDVRRLNDKIDGVDKRLCDKIDEVDKRLCDKIDEVDKRLCGKIDEVDKRLSGKIDEVDKRLNGKIDEVDKRLGGKIDNLRESMDQQFTKLNVGRARDRVWFLLIGATILGVMAHGFKWI